MVVRVLLSFVTIFQIIFAMNFPKRVIVTSTPIAQVPVKGPYFIVQLLPKPDMERISSKRQLLVDQVLYHSETAEVREKYDEREKTFLNNYNRLNVNKKNPAIISRIPEEINDERSAAPTEIKENNLQPPSTVVKNHYYQDMVMSINYPYMYEFGHIFEKLNSEWEERFERMNLKDHRYQGKVKWGNKDFGNGQHYYDLNHHHHHQQN